MTFEEMTFKIVAKYMDEGATLEGAVEMLAANLKNALMESGLYEELRAKATPPPAAEVPAVVASPALTSRNETIAAIKASLKARGLRYSVTGGRGTAWGWITVDLMPAQLRSDDELFTKELRIQMNKNFGLQGGSYISIPSSSAYYREYIDRAAGREPSVKGEPYWD